MIKTAVLVGGPMDGHEQDVPDLTRGIPWMLPELMFTLKGKPVVYAAAPHPDDEPGKVTYRECRTVKK